MAWISGLCLVRIDDGDGIGERRGGGGSGAWWCVRSFVRALYHPPPHPIPSHLHLSPRAHMPIPSHDALMHTNGDERAIARAKARCRLSAHPQPPPHPSLPPLIHHQPHRAPTIHPTAQPTSPLATTVITAIIAIIASHRITHRRPRRGQASAKYSAVGKESTRIISEIESGREDRRSRIGARVERASMHSAHPLYA
ncbi:uncharacterized protein K452DRAFT_312800 [Aplosporella prunicola CBS 121167]|uniref:Uncharacterized protein n=1 Tax=Aplosporella prunicola CBS 121167 TaxID=1176127 RepID=A0A6A6B0B3_9PEZI|nr:uncharacterized protein K452DRAFT_312800 [Aplosporella prunicola CBS 121167]KAF2136883.1 hypothetical protein K452DRAFT_312800 [Aplosporella prunicola CBS 121167]